nr:unnamed protein product [Digitaria exilis]
MGGSQHGSPTAGGRIESGKHRRGGDTEYWRGMRSGGRIAGSCRLQKGSGSDDPSPPPIAVGWGENLRGLGCGGSIMLSCVGL